MRGKAHECVWVLGVRLTKGWVQHFNRFVRVRVRMSLRLYGGHGHVENVGVWGNDVSCRGWGVFVALHLGVGCADV